MRLIPGWKHILLFAAPLAIGAGLLAGAYFYSSSASAAAAAASTHPVPANPAVDVPPATGLLVHVIGAVVNPGIYRLPRGGRVYDAIAAAGGVTANADRKRPSKLGGPVQEGAQ